MNFSSGEAGEGGDLVALLFTDIVGSTALLERLGPERGDDALRRHFSLLDAALAQHGGRRIKSTGDGLHAVFAEATVAVRCALELQRQVRADPDAIRMRAGIHWGPVREHDADLLGTAVVVARRLCDAAQAGEILLSEAARDNVGPELDADLLAAGPYALKGLARPVESFAVAWADAPGVRHQAGIPIYVPLPTALQGADASGLVGRRTQLERLRAQARAAAEGSCAVTLIRGEAGIGKSTLVARLGAELHAAGTLVLHGRCDPSGGSPFGPVVEALGEYVAAWPPERLRAQLGHRANDLALLFPSAGTAQRAALEDRELMGSAMFEAVAALLGEAGRAGPVVLVLEDMHWAQPATVRLVRHLVLRSPPPGVLVVGTTRLVEGEQNAELADLLAALADAAGHERIELDGLDVAETAELAHALVGGRPDRKLTSALYDGARGNPLFTAQLLRHWVEQLHVVGDDTGLRLHPSRHPDGVPPAVGDAIGQRLRRLPPGAGAALGVAAVVGPRFSLGVVEHVLGTGAAVLDGLDAAVTARLVFEEPDRPGRYTFAHDLVRQAILTQHTLTRRMRLHRQVGDALLAVHGDGDEFIFELAHHFAAAADDGRREQAVAYLVRAGRSALAHLAYDSAIDCFRRALRLLDTEPVSDGARSRCEATIGLGEAQRCAGHPSYRETLLAGGRQACDLRAGELAARAALANNRGFVSSVGSVDHERIEALRDALALLPAGDSLLRARCQARLVMELTYEGDGTGLRLVSDESVAVARRLGDRVTLAWALLSRYIAFWGAHGTDIRAPAIAEAEVLCAGLDDRVLKFWCAFLRCHRALERGRAPDALAAAGEALEIATALQQPSLHWFALHMLSMHRMLVGPAQQADELAIAAFRAGLAAGEPDAPGWSGCSIAAVRLLQGRLHELENLAEAQAVIVAVMPVTRWFCRATAACHLAERGDLDGAQAVLDELAADDFADLPHDFTYLGTLAFIALACARVGDRTRAALVYERLKPFAGRVIDCGPSVLGPTELYLGVAAGASGGDPDGHFATALEQAERIGAEPWTALIRFEWARALVVRGSAGDAAHARRLYAEVAAAADADGRPVLAARARGSAVGLETSGTPAP